MKNRKGKGALKEKAVSMLLIAALAFCVNLSFLDPWMASAEDEGSSVEEVEIGEADLQGENDSADQLLEDLQEDDGALLFAVGASSSEDEEGGDCDKTVTLSYGGKINYEDYHTHNFKVTCDGQKLVAYCIQPEAKLLDKGKYEATPYNSALMRKALYYSYGYPGYAKKTKAYLSGISRKSCYKGTQGAYILSHLMLSYIYQNLGGDCNAFKGVGSATKTIVKNLLKTVKTWDAPPTEAEISLSQDEVEAKWNSELKMQATENITVEGTTGNSITVKIPENMTLVRTSGSDDIDTFSNDGGDSVTSAEVEVGDSFSLAAPAEEEGNYKSPEMEGSLKAFDPYIVRKSNGQNTVFALEEGNSTSFTVKWGEFWSENLSISTSAKYESPYIIDTVSYQGLTPGLEYTLKGTLMNKETEEELEGYRAEASFTPDDSEGSKEVRFQIDPETLNGKKLVVYEKLYYKEKLLTSHEDINDEDQSVTITPQETETAPSEDNTEGDDVGSGDTDSTQGTDQADATDKTSSTENTGSSASKNTTESTTQPTTVNNLTSAKASGSSSGSPKTGDSIPLMLLAAMMILSLIGGTFTIIRRN